MRALFGPAGNSDSFYSSGHKTIVEAPLYLQEMGLGAYEYQGGRGVTISQEKAEKLGQEAKKHAVALSVHAPYYISLSSLEEEKRLNSVRYILQSAQAAKWMGATRVVVHSGSCSKMTRSQALELAKGTLCRALDELENAGLGEIRICPETMGKLNQLGSLDEVMELCSLDERLLPCIDFGHLNARTFGSLKEYGDFEHIFDEMENRLGTERLRSFHSHFSKIEYTEKGGEKRHLTFEDKVFGPDFGPVAELTAKKDCHPVFICESRGTQAEDALTMKNMYLGALERIDGSC